MHFRFSPFEKLPMFVEISKANKTIRFAFDSRVIRTVLPLSNEKKAKIHRLVRAAFSQEKRMALALSAPHS